MYTDTHVSCASLCSVQVLSLPFQDQCYFSEATHQGQHSHIQHDQNGIKQVCVTHTKHLQQLPLDMLSTMLCLGCFYLPLMLTNKCTAEPVCSHWCWYVSGDHSHSSSCPPHNESTWGHIVVTTLCHHEQQTLQPLKQSVVLQSQLDKKQSDSKGVRLAGQHALTGRPLDTSDRQTTQLGAQQGTSTGPRTITAAITSRQSSGVTYRSCASSQRALEVLASLLSSASCQQTSL